MAATIAAFLGAASAAVSAYWALGDTGLLDTVGGEIERWGRERSADVVLSIAGLLVQAGVLDATDDADERALAWHAYLRDP